MNREPITEKQLVVLRDFGPALDRLTKFEAQFLIGFLMGPPPGMTRGQQLLVYRKLAEFDRERVQKLISWLMVPSYPPDANKAP